MNIFGGIVNCATIARGITSAGKEIKLTLPLVVRLEGTQHVDLCASYYHTTGTNVDEARKILSNSELDIIAADDLGEAAQKAVASIS